MSSLALPVRLATREVRRRPGRTLLVALLVALPVTGMAFAITIVRTDHRTRAEEWASFAGTADARLEAGGFFPGGDVVVVERTPTEEQVDRPAPAELPAGSRTIEWVRGYARVRAADGEHRSSMEVGDLPVDDPMTQGLYEIVDGRAPAAAGEVALARDVAGRLGVRLGEVLELERPALRLDVVGLVEEPACLHCDTALFAPGAVPEELQRGGFPRSFLVDLPDGLSAGELASLGARQDVELRTEFVEGPYSGIDGRDQGVRWSYVIGGVVLTVMGIIISAAFAVGARRQLVTLGQLSASGASPSTVRTMLVLQGTVTGLVGTVVGLALAAGLLLGFHDAIERASGHRFGAYEVRPFDHVIVVAIGVVAATLAALIPARSAARLPTLAALAGRRPLAPVPRRLVVLGVGGVAAGLSLLGLAVLGSASGSSGDVWVFVAILGGVCELLGACAIAPALVARLEPLAGRVRGSWRLAARGLARQRTRTGAVVSAVAAAGALAIASTALVRGADQQEDAYLDIAEDVVAVHQLVDVPVPGVPKAGFSTEVELPDAALQAQLAQILPEATTIEVRTAVPPPPVPDPAFPRDPIDPVGWISVERTVGNGVTEGYGFGWAAIADERLVDLMGLSSAGRAALEETGAVLVRHRAEAPAQLVLSSGEPRPIPVVAGEHAAGRGTEVLVTEALARELGLEIAPSELVYDNPEPLTEDQRDAIEDLQLDSEAAAAAPDGRTRYLDLWWYSPPGGPSPFQVELILTGVALLFAMFVVGASLALAAAESKDERDVLTVAGAPPRSLARAAGARAWLLAGIGGLLALPIGFLPVVVFTQAEDDGFPLVFPGTTVALLLVAVPALVALVAHAASATSQRLRPVRVSTATFE